MRRRPLPSDEVAVARPVWAMAFKGAFELDDVFVLL